MFDKDTTGEVPEHRDFIYDRLKPFCEKELGVKFTILHGPKTYDDIFHHIIVRGPHKGEKRGFAWAGMLSLIHIYPPKLVETCLLAGCPEGGIVLDPFMGSGTTGMVAKQLDRHYVGIELNPEYTELAYARIGGDI